MIESKERIVGIIVTYPDEGKKHSEFSGIAGYTKNLLCSLSKAQRESIVVFSNIKNSKKIFIEANIEVNECWHRDGTSFLEELTGEINKYPGLKVIHLQHEFNLFGGILTVPRYLELLKKIKKAGLKVIVTYHGIISQKIINNDFKRINQIPLPSIFIKYGFRYIYTKSGNFIDKVIVHDNCFKQVLIDEYGFSIEKISVIPHGVENLKEFISKEDARKKIGLKESKKVILFFGFLAGYKGVDLLIDAFKLLNSNEYILILAGGKPKRIENNKKYNQWYEQLQRKIISEKNIVKVGFVPENEISIYFIASDILVLPYLYSLSASGPMSIAIAYEIPFIASDVFSEMIKNKEIIFKRNPDDLANKINEFFSKKEDFNKNITELKNERLWSKVAEMTFEIYEMIYAHY